MRFMRVTRCAARTTRYSPSWCVAPMRRDAPAPSVRPMLRGVMLAAALLALLAPAGAVAADDVGLEVLSNRADLISGGDALVAVTLPDGARASEVSVDLNGRDVTSAFAGGLQGLVTGLKDGDNVLTARLPDGRGARITIANH